MKQMSLEERFAAAAVDLVALTQDWHCLEQACEGLRQVVAAQDRRLRCLDEARAILLALIECDWQAEGSAAMCPLKERARAWLSEEGG